MRIVTVTLNPAFDIDCASASFEVGRENFIRAHIRDVGGKGVNVARALTENGMACTALLLLGRENGAQFEAGLKREALDYRAVYTDGAIRENITLHPSNAPETRICFDGFAAEASSLARFEELIGEALDDTLVCLSGSLPSGMDVRAVKDLLLRLRAKGARIILDSRSFSEEDILELRPFLIKPNPAELSALCGRALTAEREMVDCARGWQRAGIANVLVSMGERGAILVCGEGIFRAYPPKIDALSSVGAGDSMIAGFLSGIANGENAKECLCRAIAFGSAACLREGTKPPLAEDVSRLLAAVALREIE